MSTLEIARVDALSDNYVWLIHDPASGETVVVDPSEAAPVLAALDARGWRASQIWNTHWHPDHTGGNAAVKEATSATIVGPAAEAAKIPTLDVLVGEGDRVRIGAHEAIVMETPAHTAGHISYHFPQDALLFCGDTLFAMGCGRLFEGDAAQMFANMQRFAALSGETQVFGAHEYTQSNGRYALVAEPENAAILARTALVDQLRAAGEATLPSTIQLERETNPFMRARSSEELAKRREAKDSFRG